MVSKQASAHGALLGKDVLLCAWQVGETVEALRAFSCDEALLQPAMQFLLDAQVCVCEWVCGCVHTGIPCPPLTAHWWHWQDKKGSWDDDGKKTTYTVYHATMTAVQV